MRKNLLSLTICLLAFLIAFPVFCEPIRYEVEDLTYAVSKGASIDAQADDGSFSQKKGFSLNAKQTGEFVGFDINVEQAGTYDVDIRLKKRKNRGIFQLTIDSEKVGEPEDCYSGGSTYTTVKMGSIKFSEAGVKKFKFEVVDKNDDSEDYTLALDYIALTLK